MQNLKKSKNTVLKPEVKILEFSKRPQRYTKCKVKEGDVMMIRKVDKLFKSSYVNEVQQPIRVVLNNFTISLYESSDFNSNIMSFDLEYTLFHISTERPYCFLLTQKQKEVELCPFSMSKKDTLFNEEWSYDFNLFKYQCHADRKTNKLDEILKNKLRQKVDEIKEDMDNEKAKLVANELSKQSEEAFTKQLVKTSQLTLEALSKEKAIEDMLKKEELSKEKNRQNSISEQITQEQQKVKNLQKTVAQKEIETATIIQTQSQNLQLEQAKKKQLINFS